MRLVACRPEHHPRLREIHLLPGVRRWWQDPSREWPDEDEDAVNYTVLLDERIIGFAQWYAQGTTGVPHAGLELFLDPAVQGRGSGRDRRRACATYVDDHASIA